MAGLWQKTLFYLGLVDEDDPGYDTGPIEHQQPGSPAAAPAVTRPRTPVEPVRRTDPAGRSHGSPPPTPVPGGVAAARRVEPPLAGRRRAAPESALSDAGVIVTPPGSASVRTVSEKDLESEVITARSYSDAQLLADHIRANLPVVLDLRKVEPAMVRRLVDFASGLTYALGGSMRKIGQGVILVTPANVNIARDERRRLEGLGYYHAPESS